MKTFLNIVIGHPSEFSFENRGFSFIAVVTIVVLSVFLPINYIVGFHEANVVFGFTLLALILLYYYSRFRKKYLVGVFIYASFAYIFLIAAYLMNGGYHGPVLFTFFLSFQMLIAITRTKMHLVWLALHTIIGVALILSQYNNPNMIYKDYDSENHLVLDTIATYVVVLFFVFITASFLLYDYRWQRKLAEKRAYDLEKKTAELEKANEEKVKLFSIVSHDMRSPLNSILSYLEILTDANIPEDGELKQHLLKQTRQTSEMLSNLLNWSKLQMAGMVSNPQKLRVEELLANVSALYKPMAEAKQINLLLKLNDGLEVEADREMLSIALRNLISNGIKFTPPGKQVVITAAAECNEVVIKVQDQGRGIAPDVEARLFKPMAKPAWGTNNEKGAGIGLMLSKEYIELQGGRIWHQPREGEGTEFIVALPLILN